MSYYQLPISQCQDKLVNLAVSTLLQAHAESSLRSLGTAGSKETGGFSPQVGWLSNSLAFHAAVVQMPVFFSCLLLAGLTQSQL